MKKRILTYLLSMIMAMTLVTGCSSSDEKQKQSSTSKENASSSGWEIAEDVVNKVLENEPTFTGYSIDVEECGGVYRQEPLSDNDADKIEEARLAKLNTEALKQAFEKVSTYEKDGKKGGRVIIHDGYFYTGAIHLESNVELHLEDSANVMFTTDYSQYPNVLTRWEGIVCYNYSPFIYAFQKENIAITGKGTFNGQATTEKYWLPWKNGSVNKDENQKAAKEKLRQMGQEQVRVEERVFGQGSYLRPSFVQPYECKNVLIEGVTIKDAPFWMVHPVFCENVAIRDVTVNSFGYNNDGINPDSCRYVLIENCTLNTGDDAIAIKSGLNKDGETIAKPSEYIVVRNNEYLTGKGSAATVGSDMSGDVRYIFFMDNHSLDTCKHLQSISLKTNGDRGGTIEHIYISGLKAEHVEDYAVYATMEYEEGDTGLTTPVIRDIFIKDCELVAGSKGFIGLIGYERSMIQNITFENCSFTGDAPKFAFWNVSDINFKNVTFNGESYPDGTYKTDADSVEILEESVNSCITVRYSCGAPESTITSQWYVSDTADGGYVPVTETDTTKSFRNVMEEKLLEIDASKYYKLQLTIGDKTFEAGPYSSKSSLQ